jgi:hypothetical protein
VVTGAIVNNLRSDLDPFRQSFCLKGQRHRVLEKAKISGSRHPVADNSIGIPFKPALFRAGKEFSPGARHVAILARLSLPLPAVRASQPLSEGIVNNRIPKNSKMAWGAELATLLNLGICVLTRGDVVQRAGKELMPLERSPEFVGKHSGSFGKRKPCGGIEADIPDFVAEVAGDAFGFDSLNRERIGIIRRIDRRCGNMAGSAVAGMVRIIESVPRSVIGLFRIRGKRENPVVACAPIAG